MNDNAAPRLEARRSYNFGAALAGLVFMIAGALFLLDRIDAIALRPGVMLPGVLVGLGLALVLGSLQRRRGG